MGCGGQKPISDGEGIGETLDGAKGDHVEGGSDSFRASVLYIDVRQCKGSDDFAEESGFLVIRFDKCDGDVRGPDFYRDAGEAGSGAKVSQANRTSHRRGRTEIFCVALGRRSREKMARGEEGFAEMTGDDFFGIADGCEVDAGVPVE